MSLRRLSEGRLDCRGNVDGSETIGGEEVVFTTLVDDAKAPVVFGLMMAPAADGCKRLLGGYFPPVTSTNAPVV
jgi:hypothetical protein